MTRLVVVGGSSGVGLAVARRAAAADWDVTVASRNPDRAEVEARRLALDVADAAAVRVAFEQLGPIDHLVFTATAPAMGFAREVDLEAGRRLFEAKVVAPVAAIQAAEIAASIVLVSGLAATVPTPGAFFTGAINGAVEAAVRGLARELAPVRVNAVAPGVIDTPLYAAMPDDRREAFFDGVGAALPAGRVGRPEEVADAIWHLMTNQFATGVVLEIDGGSRLVGA